MVPLVAGRGGLCPARHCAHAHEDRATSFGRLVAVHGPRELDRGHNMRHDDFCLGIPGAYRAGQQLSRIYSQGESCLLVFVVFFLFFLPMYCLLNEN